MKVKWRMVVACVAALAIVAACGGDENGGSSGGDDSLGEVKVGWSGAPNAYVSQAPAPWRLGEEFGLDIQEDDIEVFDSSATAAQVFVAGRFDVLAGSMSNTVQLRQEGQDVKVFCPVTGESTEHLVGVGGITDLADITDPDIVVGIDSPGGLVNYLMNHVFRARGLTNEAGDPLTVDDLANVQILEDGGLRLAALASGDINVGSVELVEAAQLADQIGEENVTILSSAAEDIDEALGVVYSAKTEWIEENPERAAAFCATVLSANRELAGDFEQYEEWANQMVDPDPDPEALRANWEFGREQDVWPYNNPFTEGAFTTDMEVLADSGMIDPSALEITYEELVHVETVDAAVELLGGEVDQSEVETGG